MLLLMIDYLYGPVQHDAFFKKYASKKFLKGEFICSYSYPMWPDHANASCQPP